jgi:PD-(D/E)XK nuclease superfamily
MAYEELQSLLNQVSKYIRPQKEKTLFSLGGRGHYENPVSDLLAFFMDPAAEHGLGPLFLRAFLECLENEDYHQLSLDSVSITREESTENQKRIDLCIRGEGWMLLIENKIYHWQVNPLEVYEKHFTKLNQDNPPIMAILCPSGKSISGKWKGVSYKRYCEKLSNHMQQLERNNMLSKWMIFARELILHLENELYTAPMEEDAVNFVEQNWKQLKQAQQLAEDYRKFLLQHLPKVLRGVLDDPKASSKDDTWCIRLMGSRWKEANIAWAYPAAQPGEIFLRVYFNQPNERQLNIAKETFDPKSMVFGKEGSWCKWQSRNISTRAESENELIDLAKTVERMMSAVNVD